MSNGKNPYYGRNLTIIRENRPNFTRDNLEDIRETAAELLTEGKTLKDVADSIGISPSNLFYLRRKFPAFAEELDRAAFDGSTAILEELRNIPFEEEDAARARVKIDAIARYLELRWPHRYGKRLDVTVKTLDMKDALEKARARAGMTIESTAYAVLDTDKESVSGSDVDENLELAELFS